MKKGPTDKANGCGNGEIGNHAPAKPCDSNRGVCKSSRKVRTHAGWSYRWTSVPSKHAVLQSIIPGPFLRPKLAYALPYVVTSDCKECVSKNAAGRKLRSGIPDPWLDYLAWKENSSSKDARSSWDYVWLTDFVWRNRRLAMVQGIPDPWRVDFDCSCYRGDDHAEARKKPRPISDEEKVSSALAGRDSKDKGDAKKTPPERHKKKEHSTYEKVKDNMTKLEGELRLRDAARKKILRRAAATTEKAAKSKSTLSGKVIHREKAIEKVAGNPPSDARRNINASFEGCKAEIRKYNDDVSKIRRDAKLAQQKIQKLREEQDKRRSGAKKANDEYVLCPGNCGRVRRRDKVPTSIVINNDERDAASVSAVTTASIRSAKHFLREINDRIELTKDALNSPDISTKRRSSAQRRERGAGDDHYNADEVVVLQPSLFSRRAIPINRSASEILDHADIESTCPERQRYRETLPRKRHRAARESELLIIEPFSEQD